jgi:hypothetical protein
MKWRAAVFLPCNNFERPREQALRFILYAACFQQPFPFLSFSHLLKCQEVLRAQSPVSHNNRGASQPIPTLLPDVGRPICGWLE